MVIEIDIDKIKPNPLQPRKIFDNASLQELAASIEEHGLLQPILVYEDSKDTEHYFLIAGERRLRASKLAKKDSIKAINYECNRFISDKSFVQKNRSIYKTKENGDIVLNEDLGYIFTADTPRRLNNEFKGCY